jgi:hypothetical protein
MAVTTAKFNALELEEIDARAAFEADYPDDWGEQGSMSDPRTDQQLWQYIKYMAGGLRRSRKYWDQSLTWRENRAAFRYLDRGWELGRPMDELAPCIGGEWPWYGIRDEADLWEWMQRTRRC